MPLAMIYMLEGRNSQKKERLIAEVTDAICHSLEAPREAVRVVIQEVPKGHWGIGGESVEKRGR